MRATVRLSGDPDLDQAVVKDLVGALESGLTGERHYGWRGEISGTSVAVFIEAFTPAPHMVIFGAVDFTRALVRVANVLGLPVTVCDARPVFATRLRFPDADEVVVDGPIGTSLVSGGSWVRVTQCAS